MRGKVHVVSTFKLSSDPPWLDHQPLVGRGPPATSGVVLSATSTQFFVEFHSSRAYDAGDGTPLEYEQGVLIERSTGAVTLLPRRGFRRAILVNGFVVGYGKWFEAGGNIGWRQIVLYDQLYGTQAKAIDKDGWDYALDNAVQSNGGVVLYSRRSEYARWWEPATNQGNRLDRSAEIPAGSCWSAIGRSIQSKGLVSVFQNGDVNCKPVETPLEAVFPGSPELVRVRGKAKLEFSASLHFVAESYWMDATSRSAGVGVRSDGYHLLDTEFGDVDISTTPLLAVTRSFIVTEGASALGSAQVQVRSRDGKLIDGDVGTLTGERGITSHAHLHDRYGAYWLTYVAASKEYLLWALDFDFLGCPAN